MMNKGLLTAWNILNGLIAFAVCYVLIFEDMKEKWMWGVMALFFVSLALRGMYKKKTAAKK